MGSKAPLDQTDQVSSGEHRQAGDPPCPAAVDRQPLGLQQGTENTDEADLRADREIDLPSDDDDHHATSHDADYRHLKRQIEEVAGGEEDATGEKVEAEPDDGQNK